MKRVFQHPPEPLTGKKYWRSLGEYSNTPEFREWLEREFQLALRRLARTNVAARFHETNGRVDGAGRSRPK